MFDASVFGIPAPEVALMDPQQRLLLESAYCSLAQHSMKPSDLSDTALSGFTTSSTISSAGETARGVGSASHPGNVGVYIGISYNEYGPMAAAVDRRVSTYTATGSSLSVAAGNHLVHQIFQSSPLHMCISLDHL